MHIVYVEGNIGAGKSSTLCALSSKDGVCVSLEPVELWTKHISSSYSSDKQAEDWSLPFQVLAMCTRVETMLRSVSDAVEAGAHTVFVERSLNSSAIFSELTVKHDQDLGVVRALLTRYRSIVERALEEHTVSTAYLRCPPSECLRRVQLRSREAEVGSQILPRLVRELHILHESAFSGRGSSIVLDAGEHEPEDIALKLVEHARSNALLGGVQDERFRTPE